MLRNFSFIIPGRVAGLAGPGRFGSDLDEDLAALRDAGITALVTLTERPLDGAALEQAGIANLWHPIQDVAPPTVEQMRRGVEFIAQELRRGGVVGVHCAYGMGRTGTLLAAWLVSQGLDADAAVAQVRAARPGSIETDAQAAAVRAFAAARAGTNTP